VAQLVVGQKVSRFLQAAAAAAAAAAVTHMGFQHGQLVL
jgi:hypothetical protein